MSDVFIHLEIFLIIYIYKLKLNGRNVYSFWRLYGIITTKEVSSTNLSYDVSCAGVVVVCDEPRDPLSLGCFLF